MIETCNHIAHLHTNAVSRTDPSRTSTLRRLFMRGVDKRFNKLVSLIVTAVKTEDVFGLTTPTVNQTPGRNRFAYMRDAQKVSSFLEWIQRMIYQGVLDYEVAKPWTDKFIREAYDRGIIKARTQLIQAGYKVPNIAASGGVRIASMTPSHLSQAELLFTRAFNDLKGITDAMSNQIGRVLADGLAAGLSPDQISKNLAKVIHTSVRDSNGRFLSAKARALTLARTETIRAFSEAQLKEFEEWGALGVEVQAEWVTAGNACELCSANEGEVYSLEDAQGLIPLHPNCRCIWVPKINES